MDNEAARWNAYAKRVSAGQSKAIPGVQLTLFENYSIRRTWHHEEWWYSCVDVMVPLSGTPNPNRYWAELKNRMADEEAVDVDALGVQSLRLPTQRGQMRLTDCVNAEILLRIVQSVRSPKAEPFKLWLARVGAIIMDDSTEHTARISHRTRLYYFDRELHAAAASQGLASAADHDALSDANWRGLYGVRGEIDLIRQYRPGALPGGLPETMGSAELAANLFQRAMTTDMIAKRGLQGSDPIISAAEHVGRDIRGMLAEWGSDMPENMAQYPPLLPGEWMPLDHPSRINWDDDANDDGDAAEAILVLEIASPTS